MTDLMLANIAGVILSLIFSYIPGLRDRFTALISEQKRLVMLGLLVVVALGVYGAGCLGYWNAISCDQTGIKNLISIFIAAAITNQVAYAISPIAGK